ncbi:cyclin-dependent protein kinase inhibitor SMR4 [Sorghum bicolor]|nr:cyclin-dependent protein kinase inhibitor SMR4 [Sorghum bicolor]|eukprot:XP_002456621.1 cyclin-dependent protein kinase inhibitor SMR4 [Sorghum bicolor]
MESVETKAAAAAAAAGAKGGGGGYGCCGWETPKREECRIPATLPCPAAPRKAVPDFGKRRSPPKNGYFQPPDLEALFALAPRRQASSCA